MACHNEGIGIVGLTSVWPMVFNLKVVVIFQAAAELAATTVLPTIATAPATTTAATTPATTAVMWAGRAGAATETPPLTTPQNSGKRCETTNVICGVCDL